MNVAAPGSVFVLDVGHGNCTAIVQGDRAVLIDVGPGATLLQFLDEKGVRTIESVVISHADADHLGGLIALLASQEVSVGTIYVNSDGMKESDLWKDLAYELDQAKENGTTITRLGLVKGVAISCSLTGWRLEVLAPRHRLVQLGVGNTDKAGQRITTNSISAVIRVTYDDQPLALCPGDIDHTGYQHLTDYPADVAPDMTAAVLLAPHHGGRCGTTKQTRDVVAGLMSAVSPSRVLVSHGRRKHSNPMPTVLEAIRDSGLSGSCVHCTQMSRSCLPGPATLGVPSVSPHVSAGSESGISCAGTMEIETTGTLPTAEGHRTMVAATSSARMCDF